MANLDILPSWPAARSEVQPRSPAGVRSVEHTSSLGHLHRGNGRLLRQTRKNYRGWPSADLPIWVKYSHEAYSRSWDQQLPDNKAGSVVLASYSILYGNVWTITFSCCIILTRLSNNHVSPLDISPVPYSSPVSVQTVHCDDLNNKILQNSAKFITPCATL